jgi:hypothetical protein
MCKFKINKKYFFAFLITILSTTICFGDQLAWINKDEAIKSVNLLNDHKNVILFCGCCDGDLKQKKNIQSARYTQVPEDRIYYKVSLLYEDKGKTDWHEVDLAYVHVEIDGLWHSVGTILGLQCDPCTLPFSFNNKITTKTVISDLESGFLTGKYEYNTQNSGHHLEISEVTLSSFKFNLQVGTEKMCTGDITGVANYQLNKKIALFRGSDGCVISFTQTTPRQIKVTESNCTYYHGAQCTFDADLVKTDPYDEKIDRNIEDELNENSYENFDIIGKWILYEDVDKKGLTDQNSTLIFKEDGNLTLIRDTRNFKNGKYELNVKYKTLIIDRDIVEIDIIDKDNIRIYGKHISGNKFQSQLVRYK